MGKVTSLQLLVCWAPPDSEWQRWVRSFVNQVNQLIPSFTVVYPEEVWMVKDLFPLFSSRSNVSVVKA